MHTGKVSYIINTVYMRMPCMHIDLLSFEESNVEEGGVEVDKLEQVHLADEAVIIFGLGAVEL